MKIADSTSLIRKVSDNILFKKNLHAAQTKPINQTCLNPLAFLGRAQVNMQNKTPLTPEAIVESLLEDNQIIRRSYIRSNAQYFDIAEPIEGFKDLYDTAKFACAHFSSEGTLKCLYTLDNKTNEIQIYDAFGQKEKHYNTEDYKALKYYKYHPDAIHNLLRYNIKQYGGDWHKEVPKCIDGLDRIFADDSKVLKTKENMTLYRALEDSALKNADRIYHNHSFVSTSTDINCAKRFLRYSPLMEIEVPKGTKYLDMDRLFNIDRKHWTEHEYLLDKNSKFQIIDYDSENNIIKAKLLC